MTSPRAQQAPPFSESARMVAVDLDGTLMGADQVFSPAVVEAVERCLARGIAVIVATGRAHPSAAEFACRLKTEGPVVSYQGAMACGPDGTIWLHDTLPPWAIAEAAAFADAHGHEMTVYSGHTIHVRAEAHDRAFYDRWFGLPRTRVPDWTAVPGAATKILLVAANERHCDTLETEWRRAFEPRLGIVRSHPLFVEAVAPGASKGRAVAEVARRLGVRRERAVAIGDNGNDISMLQWAGTGVAMGGSPEPVARAADWVAPSLDRDGAAWAIRRFVLGER